ncbi:MAG: glycosyltransferase family 9 protein [Fimbriimonadaceae bacterium]
MKLLIVKFSSIGDCVLAVPAASVFRRQNPSGFLAWAVDPRCADVIKGPGLVDLQFDIPWETWKRDKVSSFTRIRHYMSLREHRFDIGVDLQGQPKTAICLRFAGCKRRLTAEPLDPVVRLLNPSAHLSADLHRVELNLEVLKQLGIVHAETSPIMPDVNPACPAQANGVVSIAVSTGHPSKNLPLDLWGEVASTMIDAGEKVAFVGGPTDMAPEIPGAMDYCGKLTLTQTMGVLAKSRIHIAGDTGSGHISAAYGIPVVSVFGKTNPDRFRPYGPKTHVLKANEQMQGVTAEMIASKALEVLRAIPD